MTDLVRLVRAPNLALAAAGVLAGGWIALATLAVPAPLVWAALSALGLGAAGNVADDLADVPADVANRRADRPLAAGRVTARQARVWLVGGAVGGMAAAAAAGPLLLATAAGALAVMLPYAPLLKPRPLLGNVAVAVVAGLPLWYGALAVGRPAAGVVPWVLGAWIHLSREIVKDLGDAPGDRLVGRRTLAVALGPGPARWTAVALTFAFAPLSFVLPWLAGYGDAYFAVALFAQLAVLVAAARLATGAVTGVSGLLKGAMAIGLAALVTGRVT